MAQVHLAQAQGPAGFERLVALKTLSPEHRGDAEMQRRLIEEARWGAALTHRNLVEVFELGHDQGEYFVAMSWLDAGDLSSLAAGAPMPPALALWVAHEVSLALTYLHAATDARGRPLGLVHRDVSPHNVLLSRAGQVCLGDLGIAKATSLADRTGIGLRRGKFAYMAPEQVRYERVGPATDQFALGVMLFEVLAGRLPFEERAPLAVLDRLRDAQPLSLEPLPERLRPLLGRLLAPQVSARFARDEDLVHALERALREEPLVGPLELGAWVLERLDTRGSKPPPPVPTSTRPLPEEGS